ncbi:30S ribosomal protein S2 [compost metagenome]
MVDTNSDPREVDYVIPANDDASKSIDKILTLVTASIVEGLSDRGSEKEAEAPVEAAPTAEAEVAPATEE